MERKKLHHISMFSFIILDFTEKHSSIEKFANYASETKHKGNRGVYARGTSGWGGRKLFSSKLSVDSKRLEILFATIKASKEEETAEKSRTRMLGTLSKDENDKNLNHTQFNRI